MPTAPLARCPQCKQRHEGNGTCAACRAWTKAFYDSPEWRELRERVLAEEPMCRGGECWRASVEADHKRPIRLAPRLALVRSNVQGLCKSHHSRKTRKEQTS